ETTRRTPSHYRGCLLGGAVGDALGAPVEFLDLAAIRAMYGPDGITDFDEAYGRVGVITDDTQMTLFTAEGLLRAHNRWSNRGICNPASVVHGAYLRWLHTQGVEPLEPLDPFGPDPLDGWLVHVPELHSRRGPGHTCLAALRSGEMGTVENPINDSKGCGGIMRAAPVGLFVNAMNVFRLGCETAAITHGHPSGYLAAGCLAVIVHGILEGRTLEEAVADALDVVASRPGADECVRAIEAAVRAVRTGAPSAETVQRLGAGWVAEEALAIAVYCALVAGDDFAAGVRLAVNHSGDSDSTGAITGNILGALLGEDAIPERWRERVELRDVIVQLADDLYTGWRDDDEWQERYPPR
ncbi:MAG TPA: ADP-ribosylglycohydrolase family protein, partial [Longimicrobiales bacterium]